MSEIQLTTPISQLEMPDKLRTRLQLNRCMTFADVMAIKPSDWDNVAAKVVNALKRFQRSNHAIYRCLQPKGFHQNSQSKEHIDDERRFFVANNLLNAYASAGKISGTNRTPAEVMAEIVEVADLFMEAFNKQKEKAQAPAEPTSDAAPASDSPLVEAGEKILITEFKGKRGPQARNFKVGDEITVVSMTVAEDSGIIEAKGIINDKSVKFNSQRYSWEEV